MEKAVELDHAGGAAIRRAVGQPEEGHGLSVATSPGARQGNEVEVNAPPAPVSP
jgi:hypothetical protein